MQLIPSDCNSFPRFTQSNPSGCKYTTCSFGLLFDPSINTIHSHDLHCVNQGKKLQFERKICANRENELQFKKVS